jgi:hypothetical protein
METHVKAIAGAILVLTGAIMAAAGTLARHGRDDSIIVLGGVPVLIGLLIMLFAGSEKGMRMIAGAVVALSGGLAFSVHVFAGYSSFGACGLGLALGAAGLAITLLPRFELPLSSLGGAIVVLAGSIVTATDALAEKPDRYPSIVGIVLAAIGLALVFWHPTGKNSSTVPSVPSAGASEND